MTTHPTFYVGRRKRYHDPQGQAAPQEEEGGREVESATPRIEAEPQAQGQESSDSQGTAGGTHTAAAPDRTPTPLGHGPHDAGRQLRAKEHDGLHDHGDSASPDAGHQPRARRLGGPTAIPKAKSNLEREDALSEETNLLPLQSNNLVKRPS
ncbi:hypothetical protein V7S43_015864 [Phytophthora oleae]|uniref:Pol protein n=1 Tax=Phytophthora oleae TaxID=2107226 RepID=A0ABD3EYB7_9STRA